MDTSQHDLNALMQQLGLGDGAALEAFVAEHRPLPDALALADANFWNAGQAAFLREAIAADAEWSDAVDELDALLRN